MEKPFDPSGVGAAGALFGLSYSEEEASLVIIPVPWEVTTSYGGGTSRGPQAIVEASSQIDLSLKSIVDPWSFKVAIQEVSKEVFQKSAQLKKEASKIIDHLARTDEKLTPELKANQDRINDSCRVLHDKVYSAAKQLIIQGKIVVVLGGDHSTPIGLMRALSEIHNFGILQIDAHMDLRKSYEGFDHSHASIMRNAIELEGVTSLTQVGIRDFCEEELTFVKTCSKDIKVFYDEHLCEQLFEGVHFSKIVEDIISGLPDKVFISFDIDGLSPDLCPNTGTPVPGGLTFNQAIYIIDLLVKSGRKIIGFDLNEVSPGNDEWDANVGARILYRLTSLTGVSNGFLKRS